MAFWTKQLANRVWRIRCSVELTIWCSSWKWISTTCNCQALSQAHTGANTHDGFPSSGFSCATLYCASYRPITCTKFAINSLKWCTASYVSKTFIFKNHLSFILSFCCLFIIYFETYNYFRLLGGLILLIIDIKDHLVAEDKDSRKYKWNGICYFVYVCDVDAVYEVEKEDSDTGDLHMKRPTGFGLVGEQWLP